ncbi:MAG: TROVE domain-containing protein, partial [Anaerolineales bacterium]
LRLHHRALPAGLVRGVGDAMRRFDAYQLGKYKSTGQTRNMLRLGRPKPRTAEERELWGAAVKGGLPIPYTWESELSKATTDDEKRAVWNELLRTKKLGLFALIRNIRNIAQVGADLEEALEQITRERVVGSGILPFQWYKAWQAVQPLSVEVAQVFLQAITWSLEGAEKLPGRTLVACDNSGSMAGGTQTRGLSNLEIANLMGAMALTVCEDGIAGTFGDEFALAQTSPALNLLANKGAIDYCGQSTGSSTNAWKVFQTLTEARVHVDRVVLLSDMQCYDSATAGFNRAMRGRLAVGYSMAGELEAYRQAINPNIVVYSINLTTQDNSSQFAAEQPVVELAGFSESIFRFMAAMEAGESVLDRIRKDY